jgi:hypothetical protein
MGTIVRRAVLLLCLTLALTAPMQAAQPPHAANRAPVTLEGLLSRFMGQVAHLLKGRGGFAPDGAVTPPPPPPPSTTDGRGGLDPDGAP